jgi:hypothetical protein
VVILTSVLLVYMQKGIDQDKTSRLDLLAYQGIETYKIKQRHLKDLLPVAYEDACCRRKLMFRFIELDESDLHTYLMVSVSCRGL